MTSTIPTRAAALASLAIACLLTLCAGIATAQPQKVLDLVSADAEAVILVPSIAQLNADIAKMNRDFGLQRPELQDVFSVMKTEMGAIEGLDDSGPMLVLMPRIIEMIEKQAAQQGPHQQEPPFLLLLPVKDYPAFLSNYGVNNPIGVQEITFPSGQGAFTKQAGSFAVLGSVKEQVTAYAPANSGAAWVDKVGKVNQQDLNSGDIIFLVNVKAMQPALNDKMAELSKQMEKEMSADMAEAELAMTKPILDLYMDGLEAVVRDSESYMSTLSLDDAGFAMTSNFQFTPGTKSAKMIGNGGNSTPALAWLPQQNYLMAYAMDLSGIDMTSMVKAILDAMPAQADAGELAPIIKIYEESLPLVAQTKAAGWAWYASDQQAMMQPGGMFKTVTVSQSDDAPALKQAYQKYMQAMGDMKLPADPNNPNAQMGFNVTYTPNALQMEGVSVDQFQMQMDMPPEVMQQLGPMAGMMSSYSGFVTTKGDYVVMTTSIDTQLLASALKGIDQADGIGAGDTISQLRGAGISSEPVMQGYISLQGIAQAAGPFAMMAGIPPIAVPADVPPIAVTLDAGQGGANYKLLLPAKTIKFVSDTTLQIMQQMQQQGGGGEPAPF